MKVAITPRFYENAPDRLLCVEKKYYSFFEQYDYHVHLIPYIGITPGDYLDELKPDAVVFAGGYRLYTDEIEKFESTVLEGALNRKLPILGICCGMWTINYYFNGSMGYDESHDWNPSQSFPHTHLATAIDLVEKKTYTVNSYHKKVIDQLGNELTSFIVAEDNLVEGIYNLDKKIIGVQFHPESPGVDDSLTKQVMKIFKEL